LAQRLSGQMRVPAFPGMWRVVPYAIGGVASYWLFERIAAY
jgi:uncharacterized membrane protein (GlpM family)